MTVSEILQIFMRRWRLFLLALAMGVAGAVAGFQLTPSQYEAKMDLLLLPSAQSSGANGVGNPYLALNSSLDNLGTVAGAQVMSDATVVRLTSAGAKGEYLVSRDQDFNAPVMALTATNANPHGADVLLATVVDEYQRQVAQLQLAAGAPRPTLIGTTVVTRTPAPERVLKSAVRNAIAGGVAGVILGLLIVLLAERRSAPRWRGPRQEAARRHEAVTEPAAQEGGVPAEGMVSDSADQTQAAERRGSEQMPARGAATSLEPSHWETAGTRSTLGESGPALQIVMRTETKAGPSVR